MAMQSNILRIATRKSKLALWQANWVKQQLSLLAPHLKIELIPMLTSGDQPQTLLTSKSLFVKELQTALLVETADIAVHSLKDLSVHEMPDLCLAAILAREDARDAFICPQGHTLNSLPAKSVIGTTSPRRQSQLLALRPDLLINPLRGNIDTRIKKVLAGDYTGIVLAAAGLHRLKLSEYITEYLPVDQFIPAIGQGAIGVECRAIDTPTRQLVSQLDHSISRACVQAERAVNRRLGGDCMTPIAAHGFCEKQQLYLHALVGSVDGQRLIRAQHQGPVEEADQIGYELADQLLTKGAASLL